MTTGMLTWMKDNTKDPFHKVSFSRVTVAIVIQPTYVALLKRISATTG